MKNEQNAPKIRFKGFTDAWELRKLSLSFDILQNNTLSRSELSIENGAARNVHYGDILVKYGEVLDLKTEELPFIQSSQTVDKLKGSFLQNGDIIMADTAEDETAGKCTEIANLDNMNVLAGLHTIPLRPKQKYAVGYLGYYMNSGSFHDKFETPANSSNEACVCLNPCMDISDSFNSLQWRLRISFTVEL